MSDMQTQFVTKRPGDVQPGDVVIHGGGYKQVKDVTFHPAGHNISPIKSSVPAVQFHFHDGTSRAVGENYFMQTYHPILEGEQATPLPLKENEGRWREASQKTAYGEVKAPVSVDTLRDDACPVCGESNSYDGDQCAVCGYLAPPKMFQDPDLNRARTLDLRQDPATGQTNIGQSLPPVDPAAVDPNGDIEGEEAGLQQDENGVVEGEVRNLDNAEDPADPDEVDENGNLVDSDAAARHFQQGGEPFTPGPNAPTPGAPMEPGDLAEDGQEMLDQEGVPGEPGNPGDGVPDLLCPACGFEGDGASPTSVPGDMTAPADQGDGLLEGDVCPNCQSATLMGIGQISGGGDPSRQPQPF